MLQMTSVRVFLAFVALVSLTSAQISINSNAYASEEQISFRILTDKAKLNSLPPSVIDNSTVTELDDSQAVGVALVVIAGAIAASIFADTVSDFLHNALNEGGMVIDATGDEVVMQPHPSLNPRYVLYVTKDGVELIELNEREKVLPALKEFVSGFFK